MTVTDRISEPGNAAAIIHVRLFVCFHSIILLGGKYTYFITERISVGGNAIASVRLSVRPFVSTLSPEPTDR